MPRIRITGDDANGVAATANDDIWFTRIGQFVYSDTVAFQFNAVTNTVYNVEGSAAGGVIGVLSDSAATNCAVVIGAQGSVYGDQSAVAMVGDGHSITNLGSADSRTGVTLGVYGDNGVIVNAGAAVASAIQAGLDNDGLLISGMSGSITNTGTVVAGDDGIALFGALGVISNLGTVTAAEDGIDIRGGGNAISNSGQITGRDDGIDITARQGEVNTILNTGTIATATGATDNYAIEGGGGDEIVTNAGQIIGDVRLFRGDDVYEGRNGVIIGKIMAGSGDDRLLGGVGDEVFFGENGQDVLFGRAGDDALRGGSGDDEVRGGWGDDVLSGDAGRDRLFGGRDDDNLNGGKGDDRLVGGRGDDLLTGGTGVDRFVFGLTSDNDVISDFEVGLDRIHLKALDIQGFAELSAAMTQSRGDSFIDLGALGGSGILVVEGTAGDLTAGDFIF